MTTIAVKENKTPDGGTDFHGKHSRSIKNRISSANGVRDVARQRVSWIRFVTVVHNGEWRTFDYQA